ncbi:hypothetical protein SH449x_000782 [Pirellulaceae bacterium SH449]
MARLELRKLRYGQVVFRQLCTIDIASEFDIFAFRPTCFAVTKNENEKLILVPFSELGQKKQNGILLEELAMRAEKESIPLQHGSFYSTQREAYEAELRYLNDMKPMYADQKDSTEYKALCWTIDYLTLAVQFISN